MARLLRLGCGQEAQLGHESMIVERHFAIHTAGKGVLRQFILEELAGLSRPALALLKPAEGQSPDQLAGGLGDNVIVGRRAAASEVGQVMLMPPDLGQGLFVVLEESPSAVPALEESPRPRPGDEPQSYLYAARPVHSREEGIQPPPGAQLVGCSFREASALARRRMRPPGRLYGDAATAPRPA